MNPISMVAAITTLILPIDYKTNIDDGLSEKLMRMGYSQEEITHFNREKSKRFIDLELVESYTTTSTIDDKEELIQVGDGKEESLYATESTSDNATVSDGTKTMKTTVSLVREFPWFEKQRIPGYRNPPKISLLSLQPCKDKHGKTDHERGKQGHRYQKRGQRYRWL